MCTLRGSLARCCGASERSSWKFTVLGIALGCIGGMGTGSASGWYGGCITPDAYEPAIAVCKEELALCVE